MVLGSSECRGRLVIPARDGDARGVDDHGDAGHADGHGDAGHADGHGDAPGRSPDGRAIASPPVAAD